MQIPFMAYAEDCTVTGEVDLDADRLADFLASTSEFDVQGAALRALDDGHVVETESIAIMREDLCLVTASGPRGREDRRIWTRQHPVRARLGPYSVLGYLHASPTLTPMQIAAHRPIVALTSCVVEYAEGDQPVRVESEAVLLNTAKIAQIEHASADDVRIGGYFELGTAPGTAPGPLAEGTAAAG